MEYVIIALNVFFIILTLTAVKEIMSEYKPSRASMALKRNSARVNRKYQELGFLVFISAFAIIAMTTPVWSSWLLVVAISTLLVLDIRNIRLADNDTTLDKEFDVRYNKWEGLTVVERDEDSGE